MSSDLIAIIGMAGRFPGAPGVHALWELLRAGREGITRFSVEELIAAGVPAELACDPAYVRARGILADDDCFDAGLFGMGAREVELTDPQQRIWLECALSALEDAGYDPRREDGLVGVFAGSGSPEHLLHGRETFDLRDPLADYQWLVGNDKDFLATRTSYKLGLKGPSLAVQTACSTSLVAVYLAVQALLSYQCDVAIAGGVSLSVPSRAGYLYRAGMILSPDGRCRPFDAKAQGTVPGDGAGAVVLRRLSDAEAQGDEIYAVIRGIAVNNDGDAKVGYTAPSVSGQVDVILQALAFAGADVREIGFVEGHGTATPLGDPVEVAALTEVYRRAGAPVGSCLLGSVKSNLGHLNAAAGVAGLIKAVLAIHHQAIPPTLHFARANPETRLEESPFRVNRELVAWTSGRARVAAVSSFGIGGTNAHAILGEAPARLAPRAARPAHLIVISAATAGALERIGRDLACHLRDEAPPLATASDTLCTGRASRAFRQAIVASNAAEAADQLEAKAAGPRVPAAPKEIAFLFPGQGAQYAGMGRALLDKEPRYAEAIERCAAILREREGFDLHRAINGDTLAESTALAQPALFATEYALASTLLGWGLVPTAMLGHSLGEYVAACLSGVFSLEDALGLVAERGRLMQGTPPGAMLSVPLGEHAMTRFLDGTVDLAAANAPDQCVVAGEPGAVAAFAVKLRAAGIEGRLLRSTRAFHARLMAPISRAFEQRCADVSCAAPRIPFLSCVTGDFITPEQATDPAYWASQIRNPVRFDRALRRILDGSRVLVEVGPGDTLSALVRRHPARPPETAVVPVMRRASEATGDLAKLLGAVGDAWCAGAAVDFAAMRIAPRRRAHLPACSFERTRSGRLNPARAGLGLAATDARAAANGAVRTPAPAGPSGWLYATRWCAAPPAAIAEHVSSGENVGSARRFVVLAGGRGLACTLADRLGTGIVVAEAGPGFRQAGEQQFVVDPQRREDLEALLAAVDGEVHVVHAFALDALGASGLDGIDRALSLGYFSAVALVQALGARRSERAAVTFVTAGAVNAGGAAPRPEAAMLLGVLRALPAEYPGLDAALVDLGPEELERAETLDALAAELRSIARAPLVAVRGGERLLPIHEPLPAPPPSAPPIRRGGVYLITGGLGGIGITLANHLSKAHGARLVLAGRRGPPPRETWSELHARPAGDARRRELEAFLELQSSGAEVVVREADVADPAQARALVGEALARFGAIDGVIHAAGVTGGGALQRRTREDALAILRPKVHGTLALEAALRDVPIDFFVLCSSLTALLGGFGQADYAAANAFQDAFAQAASADGKRLVASIAWDGWREVGAAVRHAQHARIAAAAAPGCHPLLVPRTIVEAGATCETELVSSLWLLDEHKIGGRRMLPGTAYAELAFAAALAMGFRLPLQAREISLLSPLLAGSARILRTEVTRAGEQLAIRFSSEGSAAPRLHALARIVEAVPTRPAPLDLDRLTAGAERRTSLPSRVRPGGVEAGPRWNCLRWWQETAAGTLGRFELPEEFRREAAELWLHPALFDAASSVVRDERTELLVPFGYADLTLYERLPASVYCLGSWEARPDGLEAKLTLTADDGRIVALVGGYVLRALHARAKEAV